MGIGRSQIKQIISSDNFYTTGGTLGGNSILTGSLANSATTWTADLSALAGGGGTISGSITDNQVAFGATTADSIEGSNNLTFDGNHLKLLDDKKLLLGTGDDFQIFHNGTNSYMENNTGDVFISNFANDADIKFKIKDNTVETEVMRIVGATSRVGIGTIGPSVKLDVVGDIQANNIVVGLDGTDDYGRVSISGNALGGYIEKFGSASDGAVGFYAGAGQRGILLDATNNFLSAGTRWYVQSPFRMSGTNALELGDDEHYIYNDGTDLIIKTVTTATNGIVIDSKVDTTQKIDGTAIGTWTSTGLGIGTESPSRKLHVVGTSYFAGLVGISEQDPYMKLDIRADAGNTTQPLGLNGGEIGDSHSVLYIGTTGNDVNEKIGLQFGGYNGYSHGGIFGLMDSAGGKTKGDITLDFRAASADTLLTERFRFTHEGNLGISTDAPSQLLHIYESGTSNNNMIFLQNEHASGRGTYITHTNIGAGVGETNTTIEGLTGDNSGDFIIKNQSAAGELRLGTNNTDRLTIDIDGNVGIGTTAPGENLSVVGNVSIGGTDADSNRLLVDSASADQIAAFGNNNAYVYIQSPNAGESRFIQGTADTGHFTYYTRTDGSNYERMRITNAGDVGIGTATPQGELHIASGTSTAVGDTTNPAIQLGDHDGGSYRGGMWTSTEGMYISNKSGDDGVFIHHRDVHIARFTSGSLYMLEETAPKADYTGYGQFWVSGSTPNKPYFTDDAGGDFDLTAGETNVFTGEVTAGYIPIAKTTTDVLEEFVLGLAENNSIWIGSTPPSTDTAEYNTALGYTSLDAITTGDKNVAIGAQSLTALTTGYDNVAVGYEAGMALTEGNSNILIGRETASTLTTGTYNTVVGWKAFMSNVGGDRNTAMGYSALKNYTEAGAGSNVALGMYAMNLHETGTLNVAVGYYSMSATGSTTNTRNIAIGAHTLYASSGTSDNTAVGNDAGRTITTGSYNTLMGSYAGDSITTGDRNTIIGQAAGQSLTTESYNTHVGERAGHNSNGGSYSTFLGYLAGYNNDGGYNTFIGANAGQSANTQYQSVFIGQEAGYGSSSSGYNNVVIGRKAGYAMTSAHSTVLIGASAGTDITEAIDNVVIGRFGWREHNHR